MLSLIPTVLLTTGLAASVAWSSRDNLGGFLSLVLLGTATLAFAPALASLAWVRKQHVAERPAPFWAAVGLCLLDVPLAIAIVLSL